MVKRNLHSGINDEGLVFEIVPHLRKVIVPSTHRVIGTQGEHCSEQITIQCPKTIDGHDITGCARHYVEWHNVEGDPGSDKLKNMTIEDDTVSFKWIIRDALTAAKGLVSFSVHFEDKDENDKTVYKFSTTTCRDCEILESINTAVATYEAIYVNGNKLVIANYTPVADGKAVINTTMMPKGTLTITEDGSYNVGEYAGVEVLRTDAAPVVVVSEEGTVKATANGRETALQLSAEHDPDFTPENIKKGVTIFGVKGTHGKFPYGVYGKINNIWGSYMTNMYWESPDIEDFLFRTSFQSTQEGVSWEFHGIALGGLLILLSANGSPFQVASSSTGVELITPTEGKNFIPYQIVRVTEANFNINLTYAG